ncbi:MAG: hypothetical protein Q4G07_05090 [Oscillospiraceae bacterium]|nr:hypothetical protein [Oscillospiraceae bacterium]
MTPDYMELLKRKKMTLIMSLPANDPALARAAWANGADVVKVHINVQHRASKNLFGSFAQEEEALSRILAEAKGPCGLVAGGDLESALRDYEAAVKAGFSFISLYARHMPSQILSCPSVYKMAALDPGYTLEEAEDLPRIGADVLEASVMQPDTYGDPLSAKELLQYSALCRHTPLPVVVPTQRRVTAADVPLLQRCGVKGLMLGAVVTGKTVESVAASVSAFRAAIDALG